jgi:hypothetical protein
MAKILAVALIATLLTACAGSGPQIQTSDNYWKTYGNSHGADANGGG